MAAEVNMFVQDGPEQKEERCRQDAGCRQIIMDLPKGALKRSVLLIYHGPVNGVNILEVRDTIPVQPSQQGLS